MSSYREGRKQHVQVDQHYYLDFLREYGSHSLLDLTMIFDVSETTAYYKLKGLMAQGLVTRHVERLPIHGLRVVLYSAVEVPDDRSRYTGRYRPIPGVGDPIQAGDGDEGDKVQNTDPEEREPDLRD